MDSLLLLPCQPPASEPVQRTLAVGLGHLFPGPVQLRVPVLPLFILVYWAPGLGVRVLPWF